MGHFMSFFEHVPLAPPDPILGLTVAFRSDPRETKVNLGVGVYRNENLHTSVQESVKEAEEFLLKTEKNKEYLPIDGERLYLEQMGSLVFGKENWIEEKGRIACFQTVGGTGALKTGGTFLKEEANGGVWIPNPTWPNHRGVFTHCGLKVEEYPYYDKQGRCFDFEKMKGCLEKLSPGSIVLLHAACHNPTGCNPTEGQWEALCALFKEKQLIPFFDFAYQGFGLGIEEDAKSLRSFLRHGIEMCVSVSNAKNFSLYGERAGCLFIVSNSEKIAEKITSRVKQMIRVNYSNPPMHGAKIVAHILSTPELRSKWEVELSEMRARILSMRLLLTEGLVSHCKKVDFSPMGKGTGMFTFTGLDSFQVERLRVHHGIYMPSDGRINVCGLNRENLEGVVKAIMSVISV